MPCWQGIEEAERLGSFYSQVFKATGTRLRISEHRNPASPALCTRLTPNVMGRVCTAVPSPFYRTCQTCQPLAKAMGPQARVVVHPDIYENGGVYIAGRDADGNAIRDGPGKCMSAADIRRLFPGYETDLLPGEGQWYTGGFETEAMSSARAERVAAVLLHIRHRSMAPHARHDCAKRTSVSCRLLACKTSSVLASTDVATRTAAARQ